MSEVLDKFTVRRASQSDADDLLTLINTVQPHIPWNKEYLFWQFFDNPAGAALLYTIWDKSKLIALYTAVPQNIYANRQISKGYMVQDVMTHPDYRGLGFLNFLAKQCLSDLQENEFVGYTFPNKQSENSFRRSGWTELMRVPHRTMQVDAAQNKQSAAVQYTELQGPFDAKADEIWATSGLEAGICRSADFLNWRYSKPGATYQQYILEDNQGFMILKHYQRSADESVLHICDLVVRFEARHLISKILRLVFNFAQQKKVQEITAWLPEHHPYAEDFNTAGLQLIADYDRFFFVVFPGSLKGHVDQSKLWHLTQGDSDVY